MLSGTINMLHELPTPIPATGRIAGPVREYIAQDYHLFEGDNMHFPMGTTFLKYGVTGVAGRALEKAGQAQGEEEKELLQGIASVYEEIGCYFARYAECLREASVEDARLQGIARRMEKISKEAPEHFDEALQLLYLMWKIRWPGQTADIGRMDVQLGPWFERDIAEGVLTEDETLELLLDFWELLNASNSGDTLINVMVGGKNPDGSDAGSRLSVLMLEATARCRKTEPHINVRVHENLRPDIYNAMLKVQKMGHGQATLYNDEVIIPALTAFGVPEELAYTYTNDGCTEIVLDGNSAIQFNHIDAVAVFELAFNNGNWAERTYRKKSRYFHKEQEAVYYTPDAVPGFASGRPEECENYEEFYRMFLKQYEFQTRCKANELKRLFDDRMAGCASSLILNGTYDSVLASGKDFLRGGLAFEDYQIFSGSIPTVADCLMALKKLVFEQKKYTVAQVKEAIRVDYEGYEVMRRQLAAAPKFGNDIDEVDEIAADIAKHFCRWLEEFREESGFAIMPSLIGWQFLNEAHGVAATPDGRHYTDPIAEHFCATPGKGVSGPTALISSVSKARNAVFKAVGVCAVHVSLPASAVKDDSESLAVLDGLNRAAIAGGLNMMNIAVYDADILRKAQKDPENYQDVIVRVWGYSARFVDLCESMQNHVISRITAMNG